MSTTSPDFTMLRLIHGALRRDISRLRTVVRVAPIERGSPCHALWDRFSHQLSGHHTLEDRLWWPMLAERAGNDGTDVIDAMNEEHAKIEPALAEVSARFRQHKVTPSRLSLSELTTALERFTRMLEDHLRHEEAAAIPLVERYLTSADIERIEGEARREVGIRGAKDFLPWVLDGASPADEAFVLSGLPLPLRPLVRHWRKRDSRLVLAVAPYRPIKTRVP